MWSVFSRLLCGAWLVLASVFMGVLGAPAMADDRHTNAAVQSVQKPWFQKGENLRYRVYYGFLKAGEAILSYNETNLAVPDKQLVPYTVKARVFTTIPFFTLDDTLQGDGFHTPEMLFKTSQYTQNQIEGDYRAVKQVRLDRDSGTATYQKTNTADRPVYYDIESDARDMLSALYYLRTLGMKPSDVANRPMHIFSLKKAHNLTVTVGPEMYGEMKWRHPVHGRKQYVRPIKLKLTNVDPNKRTGEWEIWVTDDADMVPVYIACEFSFGSFKAWLFERTLGGDRTVLN